MPSYIRYHLLDEYSSDVLDTWDLYKDVIKNP